MSNRSLHPSLYNSLDKQSLTMFSAMGSSAFHKTGHKNKCLMNEEKTNFPSPKTENPFSILQAERERKFTEYLHCPAVAILHAFLSNSHSDVSQVGTVPI